MDHDFSHLSRDEKDQLANRLRQLATELDIMPESGSYSGWCPCSQCVVPLKKDGTCRVCGVKNRTSSSSTTTSVTLGDLSKKPEEKLCDKLPGLYAWLRKRLQRLATDERKAMPGTCNHSAVGGKIRAYKEISSYMADHAGDGWPASEEPAPARSLKDEYYEKHSPWS